jgi:outer membrane protein TolC
MYTSFMYVRSSSFSSLLISLTLAALLLTPALHAESNTSSEAVIQEAAPLVEVETETPAPETPVTLDLRGAQEEALLNNPTLQAVELRVRQAHQRVVQARSAYYPQATASYTARHTELPENTVDAIRLQALSQVLPSAALASRYGMGIIDPLLSGTATVFTLARGIQSALSIPDDQESYELSLQLNFLVFDGLSREFTHRAAKIGEEETEAAHRDLQRQILFAVAQGYYSIQLAKQNIAIATADAAFNSRLLKEAQLAKEAGVASLSDVLNFEVRARAAASNLIAAEGWIEGGPHRPCRPAGHGRGATSGEPGHRSSSGGDITGSGAA